MKRAAPPPGSGLEWLNGTGLVIHDLDSEGCAAIPVEENPRELVRFQDDMCRWVHGIRSGRFSSLGGTACRTCDYAGLC